MSDETGENRIYVQEIETGSQTPVSPGFGVVPIWSPDGHEIFYSDTGGISVADVTIDPGFRVTRTRELFRMTDRAFTNFDVTSDGQRFLFIQPAEIAAAQATADSSDPVLHVVLDWFEALKERVPGGR